MTADTNNIFCLDYLSRKNIEISDFKIKSRGIVYDYQYKFITNYLNKTSIDVPFYLILDYYFKVQNMRISLDDIQNITFEIDFIDEHKISYNDTKNLTIREIIDRIAL
jgi:replicative DNA helicase